MESNGYLWAKKQEHIIEPLTLDTTNIDNFRLATKDPNEIHNPEKNKNPVALGFQLEALVSLYAKQQKPQNNKRHFQINFFKLIKQITLFLVEVQIANKDKKSK